VSWSFAQADNFFHVSSNVKAAGVDKTVDLSSLGTIGMVAVKRTDDAGDWFVWHRSLTAGKLVYLNKTDAEATLGHISVSGTTLTLEDGVIADGTYIVCAWAHDDSADGLIQCGSFTGDGSYNVSPVTLGWEPQYVLYKKRSSATNGEWKIVDIIRGLPVITSAGKMLFANTSAAEDTGAYTIYPSATGFYAVGGMYPGDYIYCAIRKGPMKQPTVGTQVYNAIARTGTGAAATVTGVGFPPDLVISPIRDGYGYNFVGDRLRGNTVYMRTSQPEAESSWTTATAITSFNMDGISVGTDSNNIINGDTYPYINWFFRRYPGVFDEVAYTGTGSAHTESHNLGVAPELIIVKDRASTHNWASLPIDSTKRIFLNLTNAMSSAGTGYWQNTTPTASVFYIGTDSDVNNATNNYVAYLFATKAGISKVGSYTGNGSSQTLNAGFTGGAKFIMIKRTDSTGDWYVWDSTRGIVAGNDPHLSLNTTAAEVTTDDSIDPADSGFIVNEVAATHINVTDATYIYLAFSGDAATPTPHTPTVPTIFRASAGKPIIFRAPPVSPVNTVAPAVTGTATVGETLSCSTGTWTGRPTPTYTYQWQHTTTNIDGATNSTYVVESAYIGETIRCVVTATNSGGSANANSNNSGTVAAAPGQQAYTTPGSYSWTAPTGVTSVSVVCVGGGGGGANSNNAYASGGGGALRYDNDVAVTPGNSYAVVVGVAGHNNGGADKTAGGTSSFNTTTVVAPGGQAGIDISTDTTPASSTSGDGGGAGGKGRRGADGSNGAGGGGAAGYSGNGGDGIYWNGGSYTGDSAGTGGGGGGGRNNSPQAVNNANGGGGVGIFGEGTSGGVGGYGGSGGGNAHVAPTEQYGHGGEYGGGGGGSPLAVGGTGACRIIWPGDVRQFPSTRTADE
ncbi:hypothetical protein KKG24_03975, partial [Patescibacteria group bacterium]|nr:hypothetical protein [Patescibacteria group bacterium]